MSRRAIVAQTIILAAGRGTRLGSQATGIPKPLIPVAGQPLIGHALAHARASGCQEAVVVVGYQGEQVRAAVRSLAGGLAIRFVESLDPLAPNGVSLLSAAPLAAPLFFLQMVDHLFAQPTLRKLVHAPLADGESGRVLVDRAPRDIDLDDATKVRLEDTRVLALGKRIEPWDAVDAGCFVLTSAVFDALGRVEPSEPRTVSSGMRLLVATGALRAVDLDGVPWVDVDTPADRETAERLLVAYR